MCHDPKRQICWAIKMLNAMHLPISIGLALVVLASSLGAQSLTSKYDTRNHPKAKGVWMTVRYPQMWQAKEGERPNIVQKFVGTYEGVDGILMLQVKATEADIENQCKEMSPKDWKEAFEEPNANIQNVRLINHENQPGIIFDVVQSQERAGLTGQAYNRVMNICYKKNMIMAWCGTYEVNSRSSKKVREDMNTLAPLCQQYFNSVVLMDKYK